MHLIEMSTNMEKNEKWLQNKDSPTSVNLTRFFQGDQF